MLGLWNFLMVTPHLSLNGCIFPFILLALWILSCHPVPDSALIFLFSSPLPPRTIYLYCMIILFPFKVTFKHPQLGFPSSLTSYVLWAVLGTFCTFLLISTYQLVHISHVLLSLSYLLRMIFSSSIYLPERFIMPSFLIDEQYSIV